jgi:hypothetical protein
MKYSDKFDDDFNRIKSYVGEALGKAFWDFQQSDITRYKLDTKIQELESQLTQVKAQLSEAVEVISYYGCSDIYHRPIIDRNFVGDMSSMTDLEIDDGEWSLDINGEKVRYCYGKRAREFLAKTSK